MLTLKQLTKAEDFLALPKTAIVIVRWKPENKFDRGLCVYRRWILVPYTMHSKEYTIRFGGYVWFDINLFEQGIGFVEEVYALEETQNPEIKLQQSG